MDLASAPATTETQGPVVPQSQPVGVLSGLDPMLDDNAVRQAIAAAEANNQDPTTIKLSELSQGTVAPEAPKATPEVPVKFLKSDGAVDVEKIQASTKQLEEAVQQKEAKLQEATKSVDDLVKHYLDLENKFKNTPNPDKIMAQIPPPPPPQQMLPPQQMSDQQLLAMINEDMKNNPAATVAQLVEIAISKRLQPIEEKERIGYVRENVEKLAKADPRFLQHYNAVTAKIDSDPDIRRLKNPHRAAWLEVKEEMRLGEPSPVQAQPSKPLSPVLGGGTPPSAPSSSGPTHQDILGNLDKIDLRDRKQEAMADEAIKQFLSRGR